MLGKWKKSNKSVIFSSLFNYKEMRQGASIKFQ
jgi:hypothetical protein